MSPSMENPHKRNHLRPDAPFDMFACYLYQEEEGIISLQYTERTIAKAILEFELGSPEEDLLVLLRYVQDPRKNATLGEKVLLYDKYTRSFHVCRYEQDCEVNGIIGVEDYPNDFLLSTFTTFGEIMLSPSCSVEFLTGWGALPDIGIRVQRGFKEGVSEGEVLELFIDTAIIEEEDLSGIVKAVFEEIAAFTIPEPIPVNRFSDIRAVLSTMTSPQPEEDDDDDDENGDDDAFEIFDGGKVN